MHILAGIICLVSLIVLVVMKEPGALRQLVYFLLGIIGAVVLGGAMIGLLCG